MFIYKSFHILVPWNKGAGSVRDGAVIGSDLPDGAGADHGEEGQNILQVTSAFISPCKFG